jgi:hypothetical protein
VSKFCIFLPLHVFAGVETAEKSQRNSEKTRRNGEKTGNGDILGNRRQLLLFRILSDNFA